MGSNALLNLVSVGSSDACQFDDVILKGVVPLVDRDMEREESIFDDGDCEQSGVTKWSTTSGTGSKQTLLPYRGLQNGRITATAAAGTKSPRMYQSILTVGKTYRIRGVVRSDGAQTPIISSGGPVFTGTTSVEWQLFDETFVATDSACEILFSLTNPIGTEFIEFDDLLLTSVDDVTATRYVMDWTPGSNTTLTKELGSRTGGIGIRILKIAATGANSAEAIQDVVEDNVSYRISGWARSDGDRAPSLTMGATTIWEGNAVAEWQYFNVVKSVPSASNISLNTDFRSGGSSGEYTEWDDVHIELSTEATHGNVSGDVASLAPLTTLTAIWLNYTDVTYSSATLPAWSNTTIQLSNNRWPSTMVDQFLIDLAAAGGINGTVDLSGTNDVATAASASARSTLASNGWTVTVNL